MKRSIFLWACLLFVAAKVCGQVKGTHFIDARQVGGHYFGNDKDWYLHNIPFFACPDTTLEHVYYYRWKLYKAHLRNLGKYGYIVTEFLNPMSWDRKPFNSLNDATSYHIYEGRWLRNRRYMNDYINYMYKDGGNDRHFSEAIADAAYAYFRVNPDTGFITSQLPYMVRIYQAWRDHYDSTKGLYYIEPLLDATEYTIASIDASGGRDGFTGGDAFRPSINSYMYANALAISKIESMAGDKRKAELFDHKAKALRQRLEQSLWNDSLRDFVDRYKVSNGFVHYWHFIRGRELVGYEPWAFNLPDHNPEWTAAWRHLMDTSGFMGRYGLRTVEPSYPYYMKQYRYDRATGQRECQWNGPSWPFQTCMVLRGMANLLNNYRQQVITVDDYLRILKQYARQHYQGGELNLVEDYDPDKGGPIVDISQRSEHYNHSEFNDLVITGLCGLRPRADNGLVIDPLIDTAADAPVPLPYFCLENVPYHGHNLTILYDETGKKYHQGAGLSVYVDGQCVLGPVPLGRKEIRLPQAVVSPETSRPVDIAVNLTSRGFPQASASYTDSTGKPGLAIDGRLWYFKDVRNRWSCYGSPHAKDWFEIAWGAQQSIRRIDLCFYGDRDRYAAPRAYTIWYWKSGHWRRVRHIRKSPAEPLANTSDTAAFPVIHSSKIRIYFTRRKNKGYTALGEVEVF